MTFHLFAATSHLKSTDDHQSVDAELGNILADLLQYFTWQRS